MPGISFDRAVDYYDATRGYPPGVAERLRDAIIAALELSRSAQILEAGVGTGRIAIPFIEAGYFYAGVDLSRRMMGQLRRKLDSRVHRVHLICGDAMHLPIADSTFDAVVMVHVLHLVEDWRQVLNEAHRALRPGAAIVLADDIRGECDCADHTPRAQVQRAWSAILDELNVPPDQRRDGAPHGLDERFRDHLHALGATVERTTLITYRQQPQTVREVARRYQERMYSSCWILPDHIHAEAARRLQHWVNEQCPDPDTPRDAPARIDAMIARRT
jgi:SAM-dependent methyltransferase